MRNRFILFSIFSVCILGLFSISVAKNVLKGEHLSSTQAKQKWGSTPFSEKEFRTGDLKVRSSMAASIVEGGVYIGLSVEEVEERIGRHDAHFKNDFIPAYSLNEGWKTGEDTWQLVFLPDREKKIVDVFINKNCCSN